jgi:tRNA A37 threonylcarbamoyladenosine synthetase subunit TsaC/SUA5/YrdC
MWLRRLLKETGPLVAPSANWEGWPPAVTISQARRYFGTAVEFYFDGGRRPSQPSTLVALRGGTMLVLRKGAGALPKQFRASTSRLSA